MSPMERGMAAALLTVVCPVKSRVSTWEFTLWVPLRVFAFRNSSNCAAWSPASALPPLMAAAATRALMMELSRLSASNSASSAMLRVRLSFSQTSVISFMRVRMASRRSAHCLT